MREAHRRLDRVVRELRKIATSTPGLEIHPLTYRRDPSRRERVPEFVSVTLQSSRDASMRVEFEIDLSENRSDIDAFSGFGGSETRAFGPHPIPFSLEDGFRLGIDDTPQILGYAQPDDLQDLGDPEVMAGKIADFLRHCMSRLEATEN